MSLLTGGLGTIVPFLVVLTILVFVHEMGHYLIARRNGVKVETFSIGFGPELFGRFDRHGTRWKLSMIPLGGYVKMYGDADAASAPSEALAGMSAEERSVSFHHKRLGQRAAIIERLMCDFAVDLDAVAPQSDFSEEFSLLAPMHSASSPA